MGWSSALVKPRSQRRISSLSRNRDSANFMAAASLGPAERWHPATDGSFLMTPSLRHLAGCLAVASCDRAELARQPWGANFPFSCLPIQRLSESVSGSAHSRVAASLCVRPSSARDSSKPQPSCATLPSPQRASPHCCFASRKEAQNVGRDLRAGVALTLPAAFRKVSSLNSEEESDRRRQTDS